MGQNMTKGNPIKLIILFTLPMLLGNIFQQFYSMADTFIISRTIGVNAFAAVGSTGSISNLIIGLATGLTVGLSVITAQRFGKEDIKGIRKNLAASVIISAVTAVVLTILATLFTRQILDFMNTPAALMEDAYTYLIVIFAGISATVFFNLLSNVLRAIGDSRTPLLFLAIASVLNIVLDYVFILGFGTGVEGAGYATVISQVVSSILCLVYIWKRVPVLRIRKTDWKVSKEEITTHLNIGLPMGFQASIISIGAIAIQITLNSLGATAVAATTAAEKINGIATMPLVSFGTTMATYTAQNFGAGKHDRIWDGVQKITRIVVVYSFVAATLLIVFGSRMAKMYIGETDPEILGMVQTYFVTNSTFYFVLALLFIYRNTLQGLGKSTAPTVAGVMELLSRVIVALALVTPLGYLGVTIANPLAWIGALIPLVISYYSFKRTTIAGEKKAHTTKLLQNVEQGI
ncbi:MATE family efflux transporter [Desemzia sp. FAM 23991]|uniref:MATE family efflux transporter n=1 Tax=unclassified Desemzia TaxID=2685243 RepID=UPI00388A10F1